MYEPPKCGSLHSTASARKHTHSGILWYLRLNAFSVVATMMMSRSQHLFIGYTAEEASVFRISADAYVCTVWNVFIRHSLHHPSILIAAYIHTHLGGTYGQQVYSSYSSEDCRVPRQLL